MREKYATGMWAITAELDDLPPLAGVYVIYVNGEAVYVGQSSSLFHRVRSYKFRFGYARNIKTPWGDLPDTSVVYCKYKCTKRLGEHLMLEYRLIQRLQPKHNKQSKKVLNYG